MASYDFLSNAIEKEMDYYSIPGCAVGIVSGGQIEYLHFGYADMDKEIPFKSDTISGIGSCTKSMTAFLVLRLAARGILNLDAPIVTYIKNFKLWDDAATENATLRDLLCHRTGVGGHDAAWPDDSINRIEFLQRLPHFEPNMPFRSVAQYSNVMYTAVGSILEAITGSSWEQLMKEEIFEPLGMKDSYSLMTEAEGLENCAQPYCWNKGLKKLHRWNIDMAGACGSVMSTVEDMAKWILLNINEGIFNGNRMLSEDAFSDFHTVQTPMEYPHLKGGTSLGYALGWRALDYYGHEVQQHTGKIEGYSAFQFYLPEKQCGAVILSNMHAPLNPLIFTIQGLLLDYFLNRESADWVELYTDKIDHAPEDMYHHLEFDFTPIRRKQIYVETLPEEEYAGTYYNEAYGTFTVVFEQGRLWLHERKVRYCPLEHFDGDTFIVKRIKVDTDLYKLPITFVLDEAGERTIGFAIPLEPKVSPIYFTKIDENF